MEIFHIVNGKIPFSAFFVEIFHNYQYCPDMIAFDEIDNRLEKLGKDRKWLAEVSGRKPDSIRSALAPNAAESKRSSLLQKALSDAIEEEERRREEVERIKDHVPPGYSSIFQTDEELDLADQAARIVGAKSIAAFCHDVIQAETTRLGAFVGGWRRNALRHSWISYRAAVVGMAQTAMEAGNSESEARKSYDDAKGKDEAEEWFSVQRGSDSATH